MILCLCRGVCDRTIMDAARLAGVGKLAIAVTPRETKR
jgi:bacterioferritin-associated ferredoxin